MAEVYEFPEGEQLERFIAQHKDVDKKLKAEAKKIRTKAEMNMADSSRIRTGQARLGIEKGDYTDWYVYLDDDEGAGAAMAIEVGHHAGKDKGKKREWVEGHWALTEAIGKDHPRGPR